jgi:N-acetylmuramoyl-L-alanine amidase
LNNSYHQDKLADSILDGVKKYFKANPALARTVANQ